ncbi:hypothetical protein [Brevundimonas sp.]|uniref:hypothetical protein n=1 Tax=Brevundimonas sp. TaxID=1871086 RepID=UPI002899639C|nr:hypothetical protein [Brevundimonas sp.]
MNVIQQFRLGLHLTKLTNAVERLTLSQLAGHEPTASDLAKAEELEMLSIPFLSRFPRHVITRELLKNALLAERMGNYHRRNTILKLIEAMSRSGLALDIPEFEASYM